MKRNLLVIGYGNTLRSDDGVGPLVAAEVERLCLPGVSAISVPLLAPELAEPVSRADSVVFVDASLEGYQDVHLRAITPANSSRILAHTVDQPTVLALARDIFGCAPRAWCLSIPVEHLDLGETLSDLARRGLHTALEHIKKLAQEERNTLCLL